MAFKWSSDLEVLPKRGRAIGKKGEAHRMASKEPNRNKCLEWWRLDNLWLFRLFFFLWVKLHQPNMVVKLYNGGSMKILEGRSWGKKARHQDVKKLKPVILITFPIWREKNKKWSLTPVIRITFQYEKEKQPKWKGRLFKTPIMTFFLPLHTLECTVYIERCAFTYS